MNITKEQAAQLGRRSAQPVKAPGELLAVFCAGNLVNTKNARLHYMAESRYKRGWRERVAMVLLEGGWRWAHAPVEAFDDLKRRGVAPIFDYTPKRVHMVANVYHLFDDDDGLNVACAPIRDALIDCGVIDGDARRNAHTFTYDQQIDRKNRGVTIRISLLTER